MNVPQRVILTTDAVGGVWQYAIALGTALPSFGVEPVLAVIGPSPSAAQRRQVPEGLRLIETGLGLDWLATSRADLLHAAEGLARLASNERADLVHINQPALAAADYPVPTVVAVHSCLATWWDAVHGDDLPADLHWQKYATFRGLENAQAIIAPTEAFGRAVRQRYGLAKQITTVPNGRVISIRSADCMPTVFTGSRLWDRGKNVALLDRVAARLSVPFCAAGSTAGPDGAKIDLHHIKALGVLDEAGMADQLSTRPIFASAALYEPFGLAVLEAAACGCALVLSDLATYRENWNGAALFVGPHDEDGFVASISGLLNEKRRRLALGAAAQQRARSMTPVRMAAETVRIYSEVLEDSARLGRADAA